MHWVRDSDTFLSTMCYGIRAPTRHTLHSPFPRWRTLFLHWWIPHLTGPIPGPIHIRPRHLTPLEPGPFLFQTRLLVSPFLSWSVPLFHRSFGPLVSISYLVCFPLQIPQLLRIRYAASASRSVSPSYIVRFSISFSYWFSDVVAYPEPYLELRFSLRSVLYKVTRPLVCPLASSTQSSLVSSLPRFALRTSRLKPSLTRNGSLRTLWLFVRSSLGYSTLANHIR